MIDGYKGLDLNILVDRFPSVNLKYDLILAQSDTYRKLTVQATLFPLDFLPGSL